MVLRFDGSKNAGEYPACFLFYVLLVLHSLSYVFNTHVFIFNRSLPVAVTGDLKRSLLNFLFA
jgi:hypothetical protein